MPTETVTVLLSSEVVWQQVPERGTHNSEGPTAECGEPVSWYDELQTTGRPTTSEINNNNNNIVLPVMFCCIFCLMVMTNNCV